ncbi:hypothetical protein TWF751_003654 [Orbilia oligospora]|nr:hypothetical protein TWF751_003654 [Orbilia oligospora]
MTAHGSITPHVIVNILRNGCTLALGVSSSGKALPTDAGDIKYRVAAASIGAFVHTR